VAEQRYLIGQPTLPGIRRAPASGDPLAGEDEPWAEEDFLRPPDEEDFAAFFRSLTIALVVCLLVWLTIGGAVLQLYRLLSG
jgi:hypothetical protein